MRRVIKIGGSLLLRPALPCEIEKWIQAQPEAENIVIVGGGRLVDAMRELDRVRAVDPSQTHWLCVDLLSVTGRILRSWCDWHLIEDRQTLLESVDFGFSIDRPSVIDVGAFYDSDHDFGAPQDWQTTSDTIAAILADVVNADELALLKAAKIDRHGVTTIDELRLLADSGVVDQALALTLAKNPQLRVRIESFGSDER